MRLGRHVALKLLAPPPTQESDFRERFMRESRFAASLDHPEHRPDLRGRRGGRPAVHRHALRRRGEPGRRAAAGHPPGPHRMRWPILAPIADALDIAHAAGLVHRDVKPANILLADAGRGHEHVYLTDFGITKRTSGLTKLTATGNVIGTMAYTAPEQIRGERIDARTDLYALGCVAYQCLTGVAPFVRDNQWALVYAHLSELPAPVSSHLPALAAVDAVVARALEKDPANRYSRCEEFTDALRDAFAQVGPEADLPTELVPVAATRQSARGRRTGRPSQPNHRVRGGFTDRIGARPNRPRAAAADGHRRAPDPSTAAAGRVGTAPGTTRRHRPRRRRPAARRVPRHGTGPGRGSGAGRRSWPHSPPSRWRRRCSPSWCRCPAPDSNPGTGRAASGDDRRRGRHHGRRRFRPAADRSCARPRRDRARRGRRPDRVVRRGGLDRRVQREPAPRDRSRHRGTGARGRHPERGRPAAGRRADARLGHHHAERPIRLRREPGAGTVTVVDTNLDKVSATIQVSAGPPRYVAFTPDGSRAYVSVYTDDKTVNRVAVLDARTTREIRIRGCRYGALRAGRHPRSEVRLRAQPRHRQDRPDRHRVRTLSSARSMCRTTRMRSSSRPTGGTPTSPTTRATSSRWSTSPPAAWSTRLRSAPARTAWRCRRTARSSRSPATTAATSTSSTSPPGASSARSRSEPPPGHRVFRGRRLRLHGERRRQHRLGGRHGDPRGDREHPDDAADQHRRDPRRPQGLRDQPECRNPDDPEHSGVNGRRPGQRRSTASRSALKEATSSRRSLASSGSDSEQPAATQRSEASIGMHPQLAACRTPRPAGRTRTRRARPGRGQVLLRHAGVVLVLPMHPPPLDLQLGRPRRVEPAVAAGHHQLRRSGASDRGPPAGRCPGTAPRAGWPAARTRRRAACAAGSCRTRRRTMPTAARRNGTHSRR